jgi:Rho GDP-dissociation inhibitor
MSKTVAGWFGRTHSKSLSKELNKQGATSEQDKENNKENSSSGGEQVEAKALTKCDSLPINPTNSFESEDEAEDSPAEEFNAELGPLVSLKEQLEKDKEDESLRRWKAQLLGVASEEDAGDGFVEPEVTVTSLGVISKGRPDSHFPLPLGTNSRGYTFSLKEGSTVALKYVFTVRNNIVSGLTCINTVWKAGFQVDQTRDMMGTFAPQQEPYVHIAEEEVTPSGSLARGAYTARKRFIDDDGRVYLDLDYSFEIRKEW